MKKVTINKKTTYLYSDSPTDLEKQYIELLYKKNNNIALSDGSITVKDFCEKWLNLNTYGKAYGTIREYKFLMNSFIIPQLGYRKIKDLKVYDIKELMQNMQDIPPTAKKALQLIKRILNEAIENDLIVKNIAINIKPPRVIKKEKQPLSLEVDELLLNSQSKHAPFFLFMRYTGMRKEEIVPITIDDIDLKNKTISINKAVTFIHNQPVLKTTKNTKTRIVPILDIIYDLVAELYNNAKIQKRKLIFIKETDNQMLTDSAVKRHLESFLYDLNKLYEQKIKSVEKDFELNEDDKIKFSCHQLRHSYCTMLYYSGIKIKKAQELMGHSSADMVYNIYAHLDEKRENAQDTINEYINSINNKKVVKKLSNDKTTNLKTFEIKGLYNL